MIFQPHTVGYQSDLKILTPCYYPAVTFLVAFLVAVPRGIKVENKLKMQTHFVCFYVLMPPITGLHVNEPCVFRVLMSPIIHANELFDFQVLIYVNEPCVIHVLMPSIIHVNDPCVFNVLMSPIILVNKPYVVNVYYYKK